jgi:hypothetical protein
MAAFTDLSERIQAEFRTLRAHSRFIGHRDLLRERQAMKRKCMDILRRSLQPTEADDRERQSATAGRRRIQVTVERETVTMLVRGQPVEAGETQASQRPEMVLKLPESPPAPESDRR